MPLAAIVIAPHVLANLVTWALLFMKRAPPVSPPWPEPPLPPRPPDTTVVLRSQWPFDLDPDTLLPYTVTAQKLGQEAFIQLPNGSSNPESLKAFQATEETPLTFVLTTESDGILLPIKSTGTIRIAQSLGNGFVEYIQASTGHVKRIFVMPSVTPVGLKGIAIDSNDVQVGPDGQQLLRIGTDNTSATPAFRAKVWSIHTRDATVHEEATIAPMLDFSYAGTLALTAGVNTALMMRIGAGQPWQKATLVDQITLTPAAFVEALQRALDGIPGNPVNVRLVGAIGTQDARVVYIEWFNVGSADDVWIRVPTLPYELEASMDSTLATAATYGLFAQHTVPLDETGVHAVPQIVASDPEDPYGALPDPLDLPALHVPAGTAVKSPSATVLQWPLLRPIAAYGPAGAADSDGFVELSWTTEAGMRTLQLAPDSRPYLLMGPTSTLGPFTSSGAYWQGYRPSSATAHFTLQALSGEVQTVSLNGLRVGDEHGAFEHYRASDSTVRVTLSVDGTQAILAEAPLSALFNEYGEYTGLCENSCTVFADITSSFTVTLQAVDVTSAHAVFTSWFSIGLNNGHYLVRRYTLADAPEFFSAGPDFDLHVRAFGAGGGSIDGFKGGPAGSAFMTVRYVEGAPGLIAVQVGTRGRPYCSTAATGGSSTWVRLRGPTADRDQCILALGGGGGAAKGSHGGGAPASSTAGLSASATPFVPFPFTPSQQFGPSDRPQQCQGAGAALSDSELTAPVSGSEGSFAIGSEAAWASGPRGGLGGQGLSGPLMNMLDEPVYGGSGAQLGPIAYGGIHGGGGGGGSFVAPYNESVHKVGAIVYSTYDDPLPMALGSDRVCRESLLSILLRRVWSSSEASAWAAQIQRDTLKAYGAATSASPQVSSPPEIDLLHSAYYRPDLSDYHEAVSWSTQRAPVGPHARFPEAEGLELRCIGQENYGFTVLIESPLDFNVGQVIDVDLSTRAIVLEAHRRSPSVTALRLNVKVPRPSSHLRLIGPQGPSVGFPAIVTCSPGLVDGVTVTDVQLPNANALAEAFYSMMPHIDFGPSTMWDPSGLHLPVDPLLKTAPYLRAVWLMGPRSDLTSFLACKATARLGPPSTAARHVAGRAIGPERLGRYEETYVYTGTIQTCTVPPHVRTISITATGGNGADFGSHKGAQGSSVKATIKGPKRLYEVFVGQEGFSAEAPEPAEAPMPGLCGGLSVDGIRALGGGLSGLYDPEANRWALVAAGGGSAGAFNDGIAEGSRAISKYSDGSVGRALGTDGSDAPDANSGAGGSGFRGGTAGKNGHAGASGRSYGTHTARPRGHMKASVHVSFEL